MPLNRLSPAAFLALATVHLPALHRVGVYLTGNRSDAEDLIQDTLEKALARRAELRDPLALKGWLIAVQRTVFLNQQRGLRRKLEIIDGGRAAAATPPAGNLEKEIEEKEFDEGLRRALETLPEEWRDALWLREVEELSYDEIASVQSCPVGTVRSRLARARDAMLRQLSKERDRVSVFR